MTDTQKIIREVCDDLAEFLVNKNKAYGNSAISPMRVFSSSSTEEQLFVRIDDKLSRIMRGHEYPGDDTIDDLLGYLILLKVYKRMENAKTEEDGHAELTGEQVLGRVREYSRSVRRDEAQEASGQENGEEDHSEEIYGDQPPLPFEDPRYPVVASGDEPYVGGQWRTFDPRAAEKAREASEG